MARQFDVFRTASGVLVAIVQTTSSKRCGPGSSCRFSPP